MINVNIPKSAINDVYLPYLDCQARIQIYFGGSSSGKSKFIVGQRVVYHLLQGGHNYLICRQTKNSIRGSVANEIAKVIDEWNLKDLLHINKSDGTVTCLNGYQVVFAGLDDVEKLKSITFKKGVLTDIVVEEATETERNSVKQLLKRQRGKTKDNIKKTLTLLFNPVLRNHWIYEDYFKSLEWADDQKKYNSDRLTILKTTYRDNRFLEPDDIADLENETDKYFYDVYTLGNWGVLGNVIFTNWIIADLDDEQSEYYLPAAQRTNRRNGLDFGFSSHPAALSASHYNSERKIIYIFDELYETGLTNDLLAAEVKKLIGNDPVVCDSAEPKSIAELRNYDVFAVGAQKGKDSVNFGIDWMKQQTIVIDKRCINAKNEFQSYKWKEDKNGVAMKVPVDNNNHFIDATRYAYEGDMVEQWTSA